MSVWKTKLINVEKYSVLCQLLNQLHSNSQLYKVIIHISYTNFTFLYMKTRDLPGKCSGSLLLLFHIKSTLQLIMQFFHLFQTSLFLLRCPFLFRPILQDKSINPKKLDVRTFYLSSTKSRYRSFHGRVSHGS